MSTSVTPFSFTRTSGEAANIRTVTIDGGSWFVAADVARALGLTYNVSVSRKLDPRDKGEHRVLTRGGPQNIRVVSESGLYKLVMRSDKPDARPFQDWVTRHVLPTIRKTGSYVMGEERLAQAPSLSELEALQEQMLDLMARKAALLVAPIYAKTAQILVTILQQQHEFQYLILLASTSEHVYSLSAT